MNELDWMNTAEMVSKVSLFTHSFPAPSINLIYKEV